MESTHADGDEPSTPQTFDPAADLTLLERTRSDIEVDTALDFGPRWYAVAIAVVIGSLMLARSASTGTSQATFWALHAAALVTIAVHDHRRRSVRSWPTRRSLALFAIPLAVCGALFVAWGLVISWVGYDRFVPAWALVSFAVTAIVLAALRAALVTVRRRRPALA